MTSDRHDRNIELGWQARAACRGHPHPDWWFPETCTSRVHPEVRQLCGGCPVRHDCFAYASEALPRIEEGVWGGVSFGAKGRRRRV